MGCDGSVAILTLWPRCRPSGPPVTLRLTRRLAHAAALPPPPQRQPAAADSDWEHTGTLLPEASGASISSSLAAFDSESSFANAPADEERGPAGAAAAATVHGGGGGDHDYPSPLAGSFDRLQPEGSCASISSSLAGGPGLADSDADWDGSDHLQPEASSASISSTLAGVGSGGNCDREDPPASQEEDSDGPHTGMPATQSDRDQQTCRSDSGPAGPLGHSDFRAAAVPRDPPPGAISSAPSIPSAPSSPPPPRVLPSPSPGKGGGGGKREGGGGSGGPRAGLGLTFRRVAPGAAGPQVKRVKAGGPAEAEGSVAPGDIVVCIDGVRLTDLDDRSLSLYLSISLSLSSPPLSEERACACVPPSPPPHPTASTFLRAYPTRRIRPQPHASTRLHKRTRTRGAARMAHREMAKTHPNTRAVVWRLREMALDVWCWSYGAA